MASRRLVRIASHSRLSAPAGDVLACRRCALGFGFDQIGEAIHLGRSIFPFMKARHANSPGSARRSPGMSASALTQAEATARPPVTLISAISSPVKLRGA